MRNKTPVWKPTQLGFRFDKVTNENLALALQLGTNIFPYEVHDGHLSYEDAYRDSIKEQNPKFAYFLVYLDQPLVTKLVGVTGYYQEDDGSFWLGWFGVSTFHRGNGYGEKILQVTAQMVADLGAKELSIYSGDREEERYAHRLYAKNGFLPTGKGLVEAEPSIFFKGEVPIGSSFDIPENVVIEVSAYCNRKCPWCPQLTHPRTDKTAKMPLDTFDKIIVELSSVGYAGKVAFHFFNEPLLDDRLEDLVARARKLLPKSHLYIHTNGDFLTIERVRSLKAAGLGGIFTNQYGGIVQPHIQSVLDARMEDEKEMIKIRMFKNRHVYSRGGLVDTKRKVPIQARCRRIHQMCINYLGDVVLCSNAAWRMTHFGA